MNPTLPHTTSSQAAAPGARTQGSRTSSGSYASAKSGQSLPSLPNSEIWAPAGLQLQRFGRAQLRSSIVSLARTHEASSSQAWLLSQPRPSLGLRRFARVRLDRSGSASSTSADSNGPEAPAGSSSSSQRLNPFHLEALLPKSSLEAAASQKLAVWPLETDANASIIKRVLEMAAKAADGPDASLRGDYLVPYDATEPTVRLSPIFGEGSFSKVRFGLDDTGRQSVWRSVRVGDKRGQIPQYLLENEMLALVSAQSPLVPRRALVDEQGNFFTEIEIFSADLLQLAPLLIPQAMGSALMPQVARFPVGAAIRVGKDVAAQLIDLHDKNWLHRDIKPENILHSAQRGSVLADYGLADIILPGEFCVPGTAGSPMYMAPESTNAYGSDAAAWPKSDIFSLGVSLLEIATGARMEHMAIFSSDQVERATALASLREEIGAELNARPLRSLSSPSDVYQYVAHGNREFADLLFGTLLSPQMARRLTAEQLLAALQTIQPDGSDDDVDASVLLNRAAWAHQSTLGPETSIEANFAALALRPAHPQARTAQKEEESCPA